MWFTQLVAVAHNRLFETFDALVIFRQRDELAPLLKLEKAIALIFLLP